MRLLLSLFLCSLPACGEGGDWCWTIPREAGVLVDDPDAEVVQYFKMGGYLHLQSAFVDGEAERGDFWYSRGLDVRRARPTIKGRFLDAVTFAAQANVMEDEGRNGGGIEVDYFSLFNAYAGLELDKVLGEGFEGWRFFYGKRKLFELSEEIDWSSSALFTVERSAMANQVAPFRRGGGTTGAWFDVRRERDRVTLGVFTTDMTEELGAWNDGTIFLGGWRRDLSERLGLETAIVSLGGAWQDVKRGDDVFTDWEWVVTPWLRLEEGRWALRVSGVVGETEGLRAGFDGAFYGIVVMPTYWLVDDWLMGVVRIEARWSDSPRGVLMNFRYAREAGLPSNEGIASLAIGRGDDHVSVYGGVVLNLCPKRWTVLAGLEWERLESEDLRVYQGVTGWLSTRLVF